MLLDDIDDEHHTITSELLAELARFFLVCRSRKKSEVAQRAQRNKGDQPRHHRPSDIVSFCQISSPNTVHIDRTGIKPAMSFKAPLKTVRSVVAEAGKLVVFSSWQPFVKLAHTATPQCCSNLPTRPIDRSKNRKIPAARRENGEDMNPREWAEQLRNVREWKSRQESIRE
jgi:hypothetical protein